MAEPDTLAQQARFIFRGTVESAGASTMPDAVPPTDQTCVVHVEEVLQSPQSLAHAAGEPAGFTQLYPSFSSGTMNRMWILNDETRLAVWSWRCRSFVALMLCRHKCARL